MKFWVLVLVGVFGLALGMSCSGSSLNDNRGTGGAGGMADAGCKYLHYFSAGCEVSPICFNGSGGSCYSLACGCNGTIIGGCAGEFSEAYAYTYPGGVDASAGMTCDPTADASR